MPLERAIVVGTPIIICNLWISIYVIPVQMTPQQSSFWRMARTRASARSMSVCAS